MKLALLLVCGGLTSAACHTMRMRMSTANIAATGHKHSHKQEESTSRTRAQRGNPLEPNRCLSRMVFLRMRSSLHILWMRHVLENICRSKSTHSQMKSHTQFFLAGQHP